MVRRCFGGECFITCDAGSGALFLYRFAEGRPFSPMYVVTTTTTATKTSSLHMERDLKLLYRQRGSALRRVQEEVTIVGEEQLFPEEILLDNDADQDVRLRVSDQEDQGSYDDMPNIQQEDQEDQEQHEQYEQHEQHEHDSFKHSSPDNRARTADSMDVDVDVDAGADYHPPALPHYNFTGTPISRLSSSITSITSIDVLIEVFTKLFQDELIPQANQNFHDSQSKEEQIMYKLDLKLFETFLHKIVADLKDILDINLSNNELCYQLKQILRTKVDLSEELLLTRETLHELHQAETLSSDNNHKVQDLRRKLELNQLLNQLPQQLKSKRVQPSPNQHELDRFIELTDPYNGVLARISRLNDALRKTAL